MTPHQLTVQAPYIDWAALSPLVALAGGACVVLLIGLLRRPATLAAWLTLILRCITLLATIGLSIWRWDDNTLVVKGALAIEI